LDVLSWFSFFLHVGHTFVRKTTRIISKKTLLKITVKRNTTGAPIRSAKIPNPMEVSNPTKIKKRAIKPANRIDKI
jgi:hypothetical protein